MRSGRIPRSMRSVGHVELWKSTRSVLGSDEETERNKVFHNVVLS